MRIEIQLKLRLPVPVPYVPVLRSSLRLLARVATVDYYSLASWVPPSLVPHTVPPFRIFPISRQHTGSHQIRRHKVAAVDHQYLSQFNKSHSYRTMTWHDPSHTGTAVFINKENFVFALPLILLCTIYVSHFKVNGGGLHCTSILSSVSVSGYLTIVLLATDV